MGTTNMVPAHSQMREQAGALIWWFFAVGFQRKMTNSLNKDEDSRNSWTLVGDMHVLPVKNNLYHHNQQQAQPLKTYDILSSDAWSATAWASCFNELSVSLLSQTLSVFNLERVLKRLLKSDTTASVIALPTNRTSNSNKSNEPSPRNSKGHDV